NVKISLAGGESESRQLVLLPVIDTPVQVLVKTSDLVSGQQILPASQISFHRVGYLRIKEAPVGTRGGYWPDPLFPVNSLDLKDEPEVILLTVHAERNQPAGTYRGSLSFDTPEGKPVQKLDLVVEVFPFSLPERSPFRMDFCFSEHHIASIYRQPLTPEFFRSCMEVMGQYRLAAYPQLPTVMRNVVIYLENDGELTFDFRGLEPYLKAATEHGLNFINISFTNHYQSLVHQFEKITAVRRDNGEKVTILVTSPEQLTRKFLKEVTEYVLERGWFTREEIYCDVIDEPWNEPARQALKKAAAAVREAVPFARIYGAGTYKGMGVDGFIDTWVPQLRQFQPENYQPGDEVWLYQCLYKVPFPTFTLNRPGLEVRTQFWINWKYRITGFLYWSSIYWGTSRDYSQLNQRPVRDFFVHPEWPVPFDGTDYVGDALFFYPGPQGLLPGLRAVNIRDGVEDWEYLYLLGKLMEEAKKAGVAVPEELMKESQSLLKVPEEAVASPRKFTDSPEMIEKTREKVAKLIIRWGKLLSTTRRGR
ncbi:MAG TPA: DUF4091 domain-containing protein, partial [bacterium]|nr:DUF4091 domain-containing protein [bacterium]